MMSKSRKTQLRRLSRKFESLGMEISDLVIDLAAEADDEDQSEGGIKGWGEECEDVSFYNPKGRRQFAGGLNRVHERSGNMAHSNRCKYNVTVTEHPEGALGRNLPCSTLHSVWRLNGHGIYRVQMYRPWGELHNCTEIKLHLNQLQLPINYCFRYAPYLIFIANVQLPLFFMASIQRGVRPDADRNL